MSDKKIALVTGAGSGIGRACALALASDGWTVVLAGRRLSALEETQQMAGSASSDCVCMSADLTDAQQVANLFNAIIQRLGRLDLLFNNAGISLPYTTPGDLAASDWNAAINVNVNAAFYCLSHAFKCMQTQLPQGGRIINNGSVSAYVPRPGAIAYAASKHAITGMTRAAALDGRPFNIAVGQMDIGNVASDMTTAMAKGIRQANGTIAPEACMEMSCVVDTFMAMVRMPLHANILFATVMATQMPYVGRG